MIDIEELIRKCQNNDGSVVPGLLVREVVAECIRLCDGVAELHSAGPSADGAVECAGAIINAFGVTNE